MKIIISVVLLSVILIFVLSSCGEENSKKTEPDKSETEVTSFVPSPTPNPTYAPGTELYGMLSVSGEVVIEPKYEYLDQFSEEGLARFEDHGLWGFVNKSGDVEIPAQYEEVNNFSEGLAAVKVDGLYGFIDVTGLMVIEPRFEGVQDGFLYERCAVSEGKMIGLIDLTGEMIVETQYAALSLYCEKYFIVKDEQDFFGIIDRDGIEMIDRVQSEIYAVTDSGYYFVRGSDWKYDLFYDFSGKCYTTLRYPSEMLAFTISSNTYVKSSPDGNKWGLFDLEKSTYAIEPLFDLISYFPGDTYAYTAINTQQEYRAGHEYLISSIDGLKGLIRLGDGETILGCEYLSCVVEYGYVVYQKANGGVGVIDTDGNTVFESIYSDILCSPFGEFAISYDVGSAIIDLDGNELHRFPEYNIHGFIDSIDCWVFTRVDDDDYNNPELGYINRDGSILIEPSIELLDSPTPFSLVHTNYPSPLNPENYPLIVPYYFDDGEQARVIINSSGYVLDYPLNDFTWFPYKDIIVFTNEDGLEGILSYDGKLIFEPSEYSFVLDDIDDSDYLVFTTSN
jgi:hypothetical protein